MDQTTELILSVTPQDYGKLAITTTRGRRYHSDLSPLSKVYCYPRTLEEWSDVSIDSYGLDLVWPSRFEVHVDQVIALASSVENVRDTGVWASSMAIPT